MRIHLVGIKGVGMTALTQILKSQGHDLSGSDVSEDFITKDPLKKLDIPIAEYSPKNINTRIEKLIYSAALKPNHPEIARAINLGIKTLSYPQALAEVFNDKKGLAVTGTHGKTTTSALLAHTLVVADLDPTAIIGAPIIDFDRMNARFGQSDLFVIEACEWRSHFHYYHPYAAIITNIGYDHTDFFKNEKDYQRAFDEFAQNISPDGILIIKESDLTKINPEIKTLTFAIESNTTNFTAQNIKFENQKTTFTVLKNQKSFGNFTLQIPGTHNIENALGVIALCDWMKIPLEKIQKGLSTFHGAVRRQEVRGEKDNILVVDDYGHHPDEIQKTIQALKEFYPGRRIVVAFQPHTHTRTRDLLSDFAQSFGQTDLLFLTDIFPSAREEDFPDPVPAQELADTIHRYDPSLSIQLLGPMLAPEEIKNCAAKIWPYLHSGDLLLTIGAGETDKLASVILGGNI